MKNIQFLLLNLILSNVLICQNIEALDNKNGFRDIKFGSSPSKYSFFEKPNSDNRSYEIKGPFNIIKFKGDYMFLSSSYCKNCEDYLIIEGTENYTRVPGSDILKAGVSSYKDMIYEINIIIQAATLSRYTITEFCLAFGDPNGFSYNWDYPDFMEAMRNDDHLYLSWFGDKVSLSIISVNGETKIDGTKRRVYFVSYTDLKLKKLVDLEIEKNKPKINPVDKF